MCILCRSPTKTSSELALPSPRTPQYGDKSEAVLRTPSFGVSASRPEGGLVPSSNELWKDTPPTKKTKEKRKEPKRTLSLKTGVPNLKEFKPPSSDMEGMIERKQELQGGGLKAPVRTWKKMYMVLCGQLLSFFKDHDGKSLLLTKIKLFSVQR